MADSKVRFINPGTISKPVGYSHIAEVTGAKTYYISGQVPLDVDGNLVGEGDMRAQAEQVFSNLKSALEAIGATFNSVVKFGVYVTDISQMAVVREVRNRYIDTANPPASTAIQVGGLYREGLLIEIDAVVVVVS